MRLVTTYLTSCLFLALAAAPVRAAIIDFETQAADRGSNLTGIPDSPLQIGIATFTAGELVLAETGLGADQTGVYASQGLVGSETNPLTIIFSIPVNNVSLFVANGEDSRAYTVTDNAGDSVTKTLPSAGALGASTFLLNGTGITQVNITSANGDTWDFAIDNISFAPVPEPGSVWLLLCGLVPVGSRWRKLKRHS